MVQLSKYFNRELSWLAFNDRVLEEAADPQTPLLERLKFVSIVSTNLDEFFMIRVAGLESRVRVKPAAKQDDGLSVEDMLYQIREWVLQQKDRQGQILRSLLDELAHQGLHLQTQLLSIERPLADLLKSWQTDEQIKIQIFDSLEPFNQLHGSRIYVFVRFKEKFAVISFGDQFDRLVYLKKDHYLLAEKLVAAQAALLFPNEAILEAFPFKIIRDAEMELDPLTDPDDMLDKVEEALAKRGRRPAVRLEVDGPSISDGALLMAHALRLRPRSVYRYDVPLDLRVLWRLVDLPGFESLRYPSDDAPPPLGSSPELVRMIRGKDLLLHHPYDSFETIEALLKAAAVDEKVRVIRQTLYRTRKDSPIVQALIAAAKNGKSVSVVVELRARFDEANNIALSKELKKAGVKLSKTFADKKVHCKLTQVVREEDGGLRSLVHVATGNYNPTTAKLYTDLGLLTAHEGFGRDAEKLFNGVEAGKMPTNFECFMIAPVQLHRRLKELIANEAKRARAGDKSARIIAKINALVDSKIVDSLYEASAAGVSIDLIVRGACVLKPGIPGLSENIRVISIVDRFLEHSRIYYFANDGDPQVYLSSADWMPRNLYNRVEIAFPILDEDLKHYVVDTILGTYLADNMKARSLQPDGTWMRVTPAPGQKSVHAQAVFQKLARSRYKTTTLYSRFKEGASAP